MTIKSPQSLVFDALEVVVSCGEPLPLELAHIFLQQPNVKMFNCYGATELTLWVFHHRCTLDDLETYSDCASVPIGEVIRGNEYLVKSDGALMISGPQVTPGYLGNPIGSHLEVINDISWFPTGDIVEKREGKLICKGRRDNQIKLNGYRIHLMDIEAQARKKPGIDACSCFVEEFSGKRVISCALVATEPLDLGAIRSFLVERLPKHMIPSRIYRVESKPTNKNGKLDRAALKSFCNESRLLS